MPTPTFFNEDLIPPTEEDLAIERSELNASIAMTMLIGLLILAFSIPRPHAVAFSLMCSIIIFMVFAIPLFFFKDARRWDRRLGLDTSFFF
jgi:hypothetical protein